MKKLYLDLETAGLKGKIHTIQYSLDRGPIEIVRMSRLSSPGESRKLKQFKKWLDSPEILTVGYNLGFDRWKLYQYFQPEFGFESRTLDLYCKVLKNPPLCYFPLLGGKDVVKIKKIHKDYSDKLLELILNEIKSILPPVAQIKVIRKREEAPFESLVIKLRLPAKLKTIAELFLPENLKQEILHFEDVLATPETLPESTKFKEIKRFPWVLPEEKKNYEILYHYNESILDSGKVKQAEIYMKKDIEYLFYLEDWLKSQGGDLEPDYDDICLDIVSFTKYRGFEIDIKKTEKQFKELNQRKEEIENRWKINLQSSPQRLNLLKENLLDENLPIESSDSRSLKILLDFDLLNETGKKLTEDLLEYKPITQRIKQLEVFLLGKTRPGAPKIFPDFRVVGTATGRMAGTGGINFQGVSKEGEIRELVLASAGGDFDSLEVMIAAKVFRDSELSKKLSEGLDFHTMTAWLVFEKCKKYTYEELMRIKDSPGHEFYKEFKTLRGKAKGINFAIIYFAGGFKLSQLLDCSPEEAEKLLNDTFFAEYPSLRETRERFYRTFCTADFESWDKNSVGVMKDRASNEFGQFRYICFERFIADFLWKNTEKLSDIAKNDPRQVIRADYKGPQTIKQAIRSALFGAASGIQKTVYRQLGNYPIQSTGATATKILMGRLWSNGAKVAMMNVHDEIIISSGNEEYLEKFRGIVKQFLEEFQEVIPYLSMDFHKIKTWAEK